MNSSPRTLSNLTGIALSVACVIHCMLMPLCIASLPSWGLTWLAHPSVHQVLALMGIGIGLWTLLPGWRVHRRSSVLALATVGLAIMNFAAFAGHDCCAVNAVDSTTPSCCEKSCCPLPTESAEKSVSAIGGIRSARAGWKTVFVD